MVFDGIYLWAISSFFLLEVNSSGQGKIFISYITHLWTPLQKHPRLPQSNIISPPAKTILFLQDFHIWWDVKIQLFKVALSLCFTDYTICLSSCELPWNYLLKAVFKFVNQTNKWNGHCICTNGLLIMKQNALIPMPNYKRKYYNVNI